MQFKQKIWESVVSLHSHYPSAASVYMVPSLVKSEQKIQGHQSSPRLQQTRDNSSLFKSIENLKYGLRLVIIWTTIVHISTRYRQCFSLEIDNYSIDFLLSLQVSISLFKFLSYPIFGMFEILSNWVSPFLCSPYRPKSPIKSRYN